MTPLALHASNPEPMTGAGNWTWLIPGRVPTLVDAGVGNPRHLDALEEALSGAVLAQVLVTHGHSDHASGVTALAERMPAARFLKMPWPERDHRWTVRNSSATARCVASARRGISLSHERRSRFHQCQPRPLRR